MAAQVGSGEASRGGLATVIMDRAACVINTGESCYFSLCHPLQNWKYNLLQGWEGRSRQPSFP